MSLLLVGLLAILSQIVLLRELNVAFYGVELVYGLALAAWMAGGAAGSLARVRHRPGGAAWLTGTAAVLLPLEVGWIRASRVLLGGIPGAYLPFTDQVLVLLISVLPQATLLGLAFRWAAEDAAAAGSPLARSYAVESAGACLGAAAATAGFMAGVQTFTVAVVTAGAVPATLQMARRTTGLGRVTGQRPVLLRVVVGLVLTGMPAWFAPRLDLAMTRWSHPALIESRDSPYARITATRAGSQTALFLDDVLVYESESVHQEELAHVAALAHPAPRRIVVLGGSVSGIDRELAKHGPESVTTVEADRAFVEIGRTLARVPQVVIDDARQFLKASRSDLILIATPQPASGQSNRFYTREFFGECRQRLETGGIVALGLDLPENSVSPLLALRTASVVEAARAVFPFVRALRGTSVIVLASASPLPEDAAPMVARWHERRLAVRLVGPAYLAYLWENDRRTDLDRSLRAARAEPNTDARPVCYQVATIGWLAKFFPRLLTLEPRAGISPGLLVGLGAAVLALLLAARRSIRVSKGVQVGLAGFAGMLLETVLLLMYQARSGALYERLGVLLLAFMLGLTTGAAAVDRVVSHGGGRLVAAVWRRIASWMCAALALLGALVAVLASTGATTGFWGTALLMGAGGSLTAGVFARVSISESADAPAIGPLYAADLAGGAAGALLAGMVLVPSMGLAETAWVVCGAGLAGLLLAAPTKGSQPRPPAANARSSSS
jgi:spermidine synthase